MTRRGAICILSAALAACGGSTSSATPPHDAGAPGADATPDVTGDTGDAAPPAADWVLSLDPSHPAGAINPSLLGHYDLSGALFRYDQVPGLATAMKTVGFSEWRIGLGRWESGTLLLPTLTDGSSCTSQFIGLPAAAMANPPANVNADLWLMGQRDWFTDTGATATLADTMVDARYALAYVRQAVDVATGFGASPYLDIDQMPLAFAVNRTPVRTPTDGVAKQCFWSWSNEVSNAPPASPSVFSAAVAGMVQRVVEGNGGEPGRPVRYWEFWNEEELPYAWAASFDDMKHTAYFTTAIAVLARLDAYRKATASPDGRAIKIGLGSFAIPAVAAAVLTAFDQAATSIPADFFSFHSYSNDPLKIVADIQTMVTARAASTRYKNAELALSEWGPNLGSPPDPTTMDLPLLASTVLALGADLGLDHAHQSLFYDFYPGLAFGLLDNAVQPTPLYYAYALVGSVVAGGAQRLSPAGLDNGQLAGGTAAVLASLDAGGKTRVLLVNRDSAAHTARVDLGGQAAVPSRVQTFSDPKAGVQDIAPSAVVAVPARSVVVVKM